MTDITKFNTEYGRTIDGVALLDALALGRGEITEVQRRANSGVGEIMWIASGQVRVVRRHLLPGDLLSLEVELIGEPIVQRRLNAYQAGEPKWGEPQAADLAEAQAALTRRIGFVMSGAMLPAT